jgi:DNA helicase-2/ATP-dependent DNA helicase PcrA
VGTFHGFCQSVLENHGHLIGYAEMPHIFEDESDRLERFNIQSTIERINNRLLLF